MTDDDGDGRRATTTTTMAMAATTDDSNGNSAFFFNDGFFNFIKIIKKSVKLMIDNYRLKFYLCKYKIFL